MATVENERELLSTSPSLNANRPVLFVWCWIFILTGVITLVWNCVKAKSISEALSLATELLMGVVQLPLTFVDAGLIASGLGLLMLFASWLRCRATKLTVTTLRTSFRKGFFSKHTTDVWHRDVRNVQIDQSFGDRLMGVGRVAISSAGQSGIEIDVSGVSHPEKIKKLIDQYRGQTAS